MGIYKELMKWIGYFVLTVKVTGTHFSDKDEVSSTNSLQSTSPLSLSYMDSPGFSIMEGQNGISFSGNNLTKSPHQKQVSPSQSPKFFDPHYKSFTSSLFFSEMGH